MTLQMYKLSLFLEIFLPLKRLAKKGNRTEEYFLLILFYQENAIVVF